MSEPPRPRILPIEDVITAYEGMCRQIAEDIATLRYWDVQIHNQTHLDLVVSDTSQRQIAREAYMLTADMISNWEQCVETALGRQGTWDGGGE